MQEDAGRVPPGIDAGEALIGLAQAAARLGLADITDTALNYLQGTKLPLQHQVPPFGMRLCPQVMDDIASQAYSRPWHTACLGWECSHVGMWNMDSLSMSLRR